MTEQEIRAEIAQMQGSDLKVRLRKLSNWLQSDKKVTFDELMYYLSLHRQLIEILSQDNAEAEPEPAPPEIKQVDLSFQLSKPISQRFDYGKHRRSI